MNKNPLKITSSDEGKLSLEISKESFSDFVFSLLATPREERKTLYGGFDLTLEELKTIVDKLTHKVTTDHDVLNNDFNAVVTFEDENSLQIKSYDQFFKAPDIRNDLVTEVAITLSLVIAFNRPDSEKNFEKQTISMRFIAGRVGKVEIDIRSTEITWPAGYFSIVQNHWFKLSNELEFKSNKLWNILFFAFPVFLSDSEEKRANHFSPSRLRVYLMTMTTIIMALNLLFISAAFERQKLSDIYNPQTQIIEATDIIKLLEKENWQDIASKIRDTQTLSKIDGLYSLDADNSNNPIKNAFSKLTDKYLLGLFGIVFLFMLLNWCYAKKFEANKFGRIFLYTEKIPNRQIGDYASGIIGSLIIGIMCSIFASVIWSFYNLS